MAETETQPALSEVPPIVLDRPAPLEGEMVAQWLLEEGYPRLEGEQVR